MESDVRELLRRGEKDRAFEIILDRYETKVFHLVRALVGDAARAEEVTQDSFLKVWQVLERLDERAGVGTWIYTIARNTALTHLRSESYRRTVPLDAVSEPATAAAAGGDVRRLVDRLPAEQREALVLYYYQERSIEEVALMLDLPEGTVKSHLHRARRKLAEWMEPHDM